MIILKIYKVLIVFLLISLFLNSSISWGMMDDNKSDEGKIKNTSIIKTTSETELINENSYEFSLNFFNIFKCSSVDKSSSIFVYSPFETLPKLIIKKISWHLNPISIIKLSHVNKKFRKIFDNDFWISYNSINKYQTFDLHYSYFFILSFTIEAQPIKVTIANYYYEIGLKTNKQTLIEKSSLLGLQKAKNHLEKNNKNTYSYNPLVYKRRGYYDTEIGYICGDCGAPPQFCRCHR